MGDLTLAQLQTEIRSGLGGNDDVTDAQITIALNLQQTNLARAKTFVEMQTADTFTLGFTSTPATDKFQAFSTVSASFNPKAIYSLRAIDGTDSRKVEYKEPRDWDRVVPATDELSTGTPDFYTIWGSKFEWFRVPDAALSAIVRSAQWPPDLSGSTDTSLLDKKDDILIYATLSYKHHLLGHDADGRKYFGMARSLFEEAKMEDNTKPDHELAPEWTHPQAIAARNVDDYWINPFVDRMP